jgi:hypothetical protein
MDLSLIRFASMLTERVSEAPDFLEKDKTFQRLCELIPAAAKDLQTAWTGDVKEFRRNQGKNFQSLFGLMVKTENLKRKYKVEITPEISKLAGNLSNLASHAFAPLANSDHKYNDDAYKWGYQWQKESLEDLEQDMLYEELKKEFFSNESL